MTMLAGGLAGLFTALVLLVVLLVVGLTWATGTASRYDLWFVLTPLVFFGCIGLGVAIGYRLGRGRRGSAA